MKVKRVFTQGKQLLDHFLKKNPLQSAAALSYYVLLSLAPLLLLMVTMVSLAYGKEGARDEVMKAFYSTVGNEGAHVAEQIMEKIHQQGGSWLSAIIGGLSAILGATAALVQLQDALNNMWEIQSGTKSFGEKLRERLWDFLLILGLGLLVISSTVASSLLTAAAELLPHNLALSWIWRVVGLSVSLVLFVGFLAVLLKVLPDARMRWRDVWVGAGITAVMFAAGRFLIGFYLSRAGVGSAYGAAGSVIALMVWVYYSAVILLLGAEITRIYANRYGGGIVPEAKIHTALVNESSSAIPSSTPPDAPTISSSQ